MRAGARAFPNGAYPREIRVWIGEKAQVKRLLCAWVIRCRLCSGQGGRTVLRRAGHCRSSYSYVCRRAQRSIFQFFMAPRPFACSNARTHWSTGAGRSTRTVGRRRRGTSRSSESSKAPRQPPGRPCDDTFHVLGQSSDHVRIHIRLHDDIPKRKVNRVISISENISSHFYFRFIYAVNGWSGGSVHRSN
jgi:hypothetical protein